MKSRKTIVICSLITLFTTQACATNAHAKGQANKQQNRLFSALDRDHDGFIDQREMNADRLLTRAAKRWDSNSDGMISRHEFFAYLEKIYLRKH